MTIAIDRSIGEDSARTAGAGGVFRAITDKVSRACSIMSGINLNTSGAVSLSNIIAAVAIAALLWFGSTMTGDHDQITKILAGQTAVQASMDEMRAQMVDVKTIVTGFQRDISEDRARLDCLQHVGTVSGCDMQMRTSRQR